MTLGAWKLHDLVFDRRAVAWAAAADRSAIQRGLGQMPIDDRLELRTARRQVTGKLAGVRVPLVRGEPIRVTVAMLRDQ